MIRVASPSSTPNVRRVACTQGNISLLTSKKYIANLVIGRDKTQDKVSDDKKFL
jgi:hypothetical protein